MSYEQNLVSAPYRRAPKSLGNVTFAGTVGARDKNVCLFIDEAARGKIADELLTDTWIKAEVVVFNRLLAAEAGSTEETRIFL